MRLLCIKCWTESNKFRKLKQNTVQAFLLAIWVFKGTADLPLVLVLQISVSGTEIGNWTGHQRRIELGWRITGSGLDEMWLHLKNDVTGLLQVVDRERLYFAYEDFCRTVANVTTLVSELVFVRILNKKTLFAERTSGSQAWVRFSLVYYELNIPIIDLLLLCVWCFMLSKVLH